jgi:uncharacterized damage-inducible protein DinB
MRTHFAMMAKYNAWANARLYRMAAAMPDDLYRKEIDVYFKSLHGTLNHLLTADSIWMRRFTGEGNPPDKLNAIMFDDLASLHSARVEMDGRIIQFSRSLSNLDIEEIFEYRTLNGTVQREPRRDCLAHMFNHQTHHRGQAHAILTFVGVAEPEPLDLLIMLRERN